MYMLTSGCPPQRADVTAKPTDRKLKNDVPLVIEACLIRVRRSNPRSQPRIVRVGGVSGYRRDQGPEYRS